MKNKKELNNIFKIMLLFIFAVGMIMVGIYIDYYRGGKGLFFDEYNKELTNNLKTIVKKQEKTDDLIKQAIEDTSYTFDRPYILENPYYINPLSAIVIFHTPESVSIDVYINDKLVTKTADDNEHIIPIYGLYANSRNIIKLVTSEGAEKTFEILTETYNDNLYDYDLSVNLNGKNHVLIVGEIPGNNLVRGFDYNNNLIYYLDLKNINAFSVKDNHLLLSYTSLSITNNKLENLLLEVDYLGHIINIQEDSYLNNMQPNLIIDKNEYIIESTNLYPEVIEKYNVGNLIDNKNFTEYKESEFKVFDKKIINCELYNDNYTVVYMGNYITYEFTNIDENSRLILVDQKNKVKEYEIYNRNIIKVPDLDGAVLYLYNNGEYYNLLLKIKN